MIKSELAHEVGKSEEKTAIAQELTTKLVTSVFQSGAEIGYRGILAVPHLPIEDDVTRAMNPKFQESMDLGLLVGVTRPGEKGVVTHSIVIPEGTIRQIATDRTSFGSLHTVMVARNSGGIIIPLLSNVMLMEGLVRAAVKDLEQHNINVKELKKPRLTLVKDALREIGLKNGTRAQVDEATREPDEWDNIKVIENSPKGISRVLHWVRPHTKNS